MDTIRALVNAQYRNQQFLAVADKFVEADMFSFGRKLLYCTQTLEVGLRVSVMNAHNRYRLVRQ